MMRNNIQNHVNEYPNRRRISTLATSDAKTDDLPIDYILVYHDYDEKSNDKETFKAQRARRERFEDYLSKQGLLLEHVVRKNQ